MDNTEEFKEPMSHPEIASELFIMVEADQDMREKNDKDRSFWDEEIDLKNTKRMKEIVAEYGFPTISMVGTEGSKQAWLLVQHADHDLEFQKECLELMKKLPREEIDITRIAYLEDRVRVNKKHLQLYGTQFNQKDGKHVPKPIEDEDKINDRRANLGMGTLDDQIKSMYKKYGEPDEWEISGKPELGVKVINSELIKVLVSLRKQIDGDKPDLEKEAERYAKGEECKAFILVKNSEPVGYVEVQLSDDLPIGAEVDFDLSKFAHLTRVGVVKSERDKDLGTELIKTAEQYSINSGKQGIWLDFLKKIEGFYIKMGYEILPEFIDKKGKSRKIAVKYFNRE